ncbi:MAG: T9SS type A sorting domain-containing protein [Crocinitomicaceae bacterium]|nr:T9SS type A sorting domain-containing protein [Crocinitomicaceae bacterium]
MKASITYLIVLVFTIQQSYGQNYQTVQSNEIHYFSNQDFEYVLASRTDMVELQGGDSVFYSYQTVREDENLPATATCKYYLGAPWTGQKTVIKTDGRNIFYNKNNEPITIQTQAALNDTFLVYTYPSGDWIKGVVTNELQLMIFEEMDDIKIIELISNVPLQFSDDRLILSKNHGFIETYAFYSFPEPYKGASSITGDNSYPLNYTGNFELVGIDNDGFNKPTTGQIYDFEIGNEYKFFSSQETPENGLVEVYKERTIVNRFDWMGDSITYFIKEDVQEVHYPVNGPSETTITEGELKSVTYKNLQKRNTPYLPEEFDGVNGWSALLINSCGDVEEVIRKEAFTTDGVNPCLYQNTFGANLVYRVISGTGWLEPKGTSDAGAVEYTSDLVYYSKVDGSTCGTNQYLNIENETAEEADFKLYPNPTNGDVFIELKAVTENTTVSVYDNSGRLYMTLNPNPDEDVYFDVSDFSPGIYTVLVETETATLQQKLIKH